jgi:hypothetical protein
MDPPEHAEPHVALVTPVADAHPQNWVGSGEAVMPENAVAACTALTMPLAAKPWVENRLARVLTLKRRSHPQRVEVESVSSAFVIIRKPVSDSVPLGSESAQLTTALRCFLPKYIRTTVFFP